MGDFSGEEIYAIDAKGRVNIPAKMRRQIQPEGSVTLKLTRGFEKCIYAYPLEEWKLIKDKLDQLNQFDKKSRYFLRTFYKWVVDVQIDDQHRIILPKKLMDFAGIDGKTLIIGQGNHIEFWNEEIYNDYDDSFEESYEDIAAELLV
ncbi:MAG: transcriptional regulator MraZ [Bacteroidota bacterium]|nr:transcriptional regulator MraZ [Bacteroidota bacterium]